MFTSSSRSGRAHRQQPPAGTIDPQVYTRDLWRDANQVLALLYPAERRVIVESTTATLLGTGTLYVPRSDDDAEVVAGLAAATPPLLEPIVVKRSACGYLPTPLGRCVALVMFMEGARAQAEGTHQEVHPSRRHGTGYGGQGDSTVDGLDWGRESEPDPWTPEAWRAWREKREAMGGTEHLTIHFPASRRREAPDGRW